MAAPDARWLYEDGIGEARAALVAGPRILAAAIEPAGTLTVGTRAAARLVERLPRRQGRAVLDDGAELLVADLPAGMAEGARLAIETVREPIAERGRRKPARAVAQDGPPPATRRPGPSLLDRIVATGLPVDRPAAHQADALEAAGWSELLEEASGGAIAFSGGQLLMSVTPAMTLFDVDGHLDPEPLALAAAAAVAAAVTRHGLGGSIGIDFPTLAGKAPRQAVAAALDAALASAAVSVPFERTAINGFGFLQLVRPRPRPSLPERLLFDPARAGTAALLRRLEREPPGAPLTHPVSPAIARTLAAHPAWSAELARRTGVHHRLEPRP